MFSIFLITICLLNLILICHATNLSVLVKIPISNYLLEKQNRVGVKKTLTFKKGTFTRETARNMFGYLGEKTPLILKEMPPWPLHGLQEGKFKIADQCLFEISNIPNSSVTCQYLEKKKNRNIAACNSQLYRFRICLYFLGTGWRWALFNRCLPYQLCCLVLRVRDDMRRLWHDKCVFLSLLTPSERET